MLFPEDIWRIIKSYYIQDTDMFFKKVKLANECFHPDNFLLSHNNFDEFYDNWGLPPYANKILSYETQVEFNRKPQEKLNRHYWGLIDPIEYMTKPIWDRAFSTYQRGLCFKIVNIRYIVFIRGLEKMIEWKKLDEYEIDEIIYKSKKTRQFIKILLSLDMRTKTKETKMEKYKLKRVWDLVRDF